MLEWWRRHQAIRALQACGPVSSLLVLCTANLVRSPFAQQVLRARLGPRVSVYSRGVLPGGVQPPPEATEVASTLGFPLHAHTSRRLEPSELIAASVVLVMEVRMGDQLASTYPPLRGRILPLGRFDTEAGWGDDVEDPFMLTRDDYLSAYERILRCCDNVAKHLNATSR